MVHRDYQVLQYPFYPIYNSYDICKESSSQRHVSPDFRLYHRDDASDNEISTKNGS